jgi:uncharacterized BrkB/YihY/UPF0761 family membrane protein
MRTRPAPCKMTSGMSDDTEPPPPDRQSRTERVRAGKEQVVARARRTRARLEESRGRSAAVDAAFRTIERDAEAGGGVLAAAVGFRIFCFLVPYVFVLVAGFGLATDAANESPADAARTAGIGGLTARAITGAADLSLAERLAALIAGGVALFLAARSLWKTLRITHALVWRVRIGRPTPTTRPAGGLVLVLTVSFVLGLLLTDLGDRSFVIGLVATIAAALVPVAVWVYASMQLPHDEEAPWWALLPGSVLFGFGTLFLHVITVYWIAREVENKSDTYGAIGVSLAILLWAYLLGRLIVAGAALNAALWRRRPGGAERSSSRRAKRVGGPERGGERSAESNRQTD